MLLSVHTKATSQFLENKINACQCFSGGILYYYFLPYFVHLLLLSLLSYSLFKMILILPLNMNMLTYINMHCISVAPKTESCQNPT